MDDVTPTIQANYSDVYDRRFSVHKVREAKFSHDPEIEEKKRPRPYEVILRVNKYTSVKFFDQLPKKDGKPQILNVQLSLDTEMSFAEAIELFRSLIDPSTAKIDSLDYGGVLSHGRRDITFQDLYPALIQRVNSSLYINIKLIGGTRIVDTNQNAVLPIIDYKQQKETYTSGGRIINPIKSYRRRTIGYQNSNSQMDETTLEQILSKAKFKLNSEDIEGLKKMIWQ